MKDNREKRLPLKPLPVHPSMPIRWYMLGECKVAVSIENGNYHLSISHPKRLPTYWEVKEARYRLCPNEKYMAMIFPPVEDFVNIHENCLQLFEVPPDKPKIWNYAELPPLIKE